MLRDRFGVDYVVPDAAAAGHAAGERCGRRLQNEYHGADVQWFKYKTYQTQDECNALLTQLPSFYKCVASNDPALKKPAPAAAGAPSTATMSGAAANHMQ